MMNEYELHEKFSETFKALEKAIAHTQDGPKFKRKLLNALSKGFPIDYKFSFRGGKGRVALMIGNAIPPEFIKRHASILAEILKESKQHEQ